MDSLVSVVIPAHNSVRHIVPTLDSILAQRHRPLEILVIDDGSTDKTSAIVRDYAPEVRLIQQPQRGHPAARNTEIRAGTGEYLAFLDHDLSSQDKLGLRDEWAAPLPPEIFRKPYQWHKIEREYRWHVWQGRSPRSLLGLVRYVCLRWWRATLREG